MKKNLWIIFAAALSTSLLAQDMTNTAPVLQAPPPEPTPATTPAPTTEMPSMPTMEAPSNPPAAPAKPKAAAKKKTPAKKTTTSKKAKAPELKTVPLVPGPAVVSANHVNVRTKAGLVGEVLTHMTNGESVTVIEEIHLKKSGPDEPSAWAKISLPPEAHVWIKSSLLGTDNTVNIKRANLRGGPGEAYGVVGTVEKGAAIATIDTKGEWTQIQAPTNAYAFMAAQYLKQGGEEMAANPAPTPTPEPAPTTTTMTDMPTVAPATGEAPTTAATTPTIDTNPVPTVAEPTMTPAAQEPPAERIVEHEGIVRGSFSIQAPTRYQLVSPDTHVPINYLYTPSTNLDLSRYKGMHIIVTGEEGLDARWKNTPVITIQKIQVLD
jgi:uncharacterized protein YgiM (DUF1202 family)